MNIPKAIEILTDKRRSLPIKGNEDFLPAIALGIEALQQVRAIRQVHPEFRTFELLGETEG